MIEADITSLPLQPARKAFDILRAGGTAPTGNAFTCIIIEDQKLLCLIKMVLFSSILK